MHNTENENDAINSKIAHLNIITKSRWYNTSRNANLVHDDKYSFMSRNEDNEVYSRHFEYYDDCINSLNNIIKNKIQSDY